MPTLALLQFSAAVTPFQVEQFRIKLHGTDRVRMCWTDDQGNCTELPENAVLCQDDDVNLARALIESELVKAGLKSSLDQSLYVFMAPGFKFTSNRLCRDPRCSFAEALNDYGEDENREEKVEI